jgi:hypothetical protein
MVLLLIQPSFTAAGYQGLEWAVEEEDIIDFQLKLRIAPSDLDFESRTWTHILDIGMEITELRDLSLNYSGMSLWGFTNLLLRSRAFLKNGTYLTQLDNFNFYEDFITTNVIHNSAAVPVGNWSYANSLVETSGASVIDDNIYWGYERENQSSGYFELWKWKQSDGTLSYVEIKNDRTEVMPEFVVFDMMIQRSEDIASPELIVVGIGTVAIATIAILWFYRRNIRKQ